MVLLLSGLACPLVVRMLLNMIINNYNFSIATFHLHSSSPDCISHFRLSEHLGSFSLTTFPDTLRLIYLPLYRMSYLCAVIAHLFN